MISTKLRTTNITSRLSGLALVIAVCISGGTPSVAYEPILKNIFNPDRLSTDRKIFDLVAEPSGDMYMGRRVVVSTEMPEEVLTFNVNGLQKEGLVSLGTQDVQALAVDSAGNRYVGGFREVTKYAADGPVHSVSTTAQDIALDAAGNVYALHVLHPVYNRIRKYNPQLQLLAEFDLPQLAGQNPWNFTVDASGNMYVNYLQDEILKFSNTGGLVLAFAADPPERLEALALNPVTGEIFGVTVHADIVRFDTNGQTLGRIQFRPDASGGDSISVDTYGSIYVADSFGVFGIDPTITTDQLTLAARQIALPGLSFHDSPQGAYLKGLASRAGRTRNNLRSVSEARQQLDALRDLARGTDVDGLGPMEADRISRALEDINGFLAFVEANSPLVVGEGLGALGPPDPRGESHPLASLIARLFSQDPFYGRYHATVPIGTPPPAHVELALDASTATTNFQKPQIWGGELVQPEVISSTVSLNFNGLVPTVVDFSMVIGSININGTPSGLNRGRVSPSGQLHSRIVRREFEGHVEGWITNDLYTESRPIFSFLDLEGYVARGTEVAVYGTNEPLIVPGLPGEPPTTIAGIGFVATRAEFSQTTNTLVFHENTDPSKIPDLSVILTPDGVFAHGVGSGEPAVGAGISITPLLFTGLDATSGRYEFADAALTIMAEGGPFGTALLTDIGIDPETLIFTGELNFNLPLLRNDSAFINTLRAGPADILLLTPSGTLELLTRTANFTRSGVTQTDFIVLGVVPEPSAAVLCVAALCVMSLSRRLSLRVHQPEAQARD